jgi:TPR repeat protein
LTTTRYLHLIKAFNLYAQAAKQGHLASIYRSGVCYEVGAGTRRDPTRAIQFYKKAAMLGDSAAMFKIGTILLNGALGQTKNPREGVNWLKRAATQVDDTTPHALHELAMLHQSTDPEVSKFLVPVINIDERIPYMLRNFS